MSSDELRERADVVNCQAMQSSQAARDARNVATMAYETWMAADKAAKQAQVHANWALVIANEAKKAADTAEAATTYMSDRLAQHAADRDRLQAEAAEEPLGAAGRGR